MERIFTIPLRAELLKAGREYKATRAVRTVRRFALHHLKTDVAISPLLNEYLWAQSRERPPTTVRVKVIDGKAYLPDEAPATKLEEKGRLEALKQAVVGDKAKPEKKAETKGEEKKAELKTEKTGDKKAVAQKTETKGAEKKADGRVAEDKKVVEQTGAGTQKK